MHNFKAGETAVLKNRWTVARKVELVSVRWDYVARPPVPYVAYVDETGFFGETDGANIAPMFMDPMAPTSFTSLPITGT